MEIRYGNKENGNGEVRNITSTHSTLSMLMKNLNNAMHIFTSVLQIQKELMRDKLISRCLEFTKCSRMRNSAKIALFLPLFKNR